MGCNIIKPPEDFTTLRVISNKEKVLYNTNRLQGVTLNNE